MGRRIINLSETFGQLVFFLLAASIIGWLTPRFLVTGIIVIIVLASMNLGVMFYDGRLSDIPSLLTSAAIACGLLQAIPRDGRMVLRHFLSPRGRIGRTNWLVSSFGVFAFKLLILAVIGVLNGADIFPERRSADVPVFRETRDSADRILSAIGRIPVAPVVDAAIVADAALSIPLGTAHLSVSERPLYAKIIQNTDALARSFPADPWRDNELRAVLTDAGATGLASLPGGHPILGTPALGFALVGLLLLWPSLALNAKRWHDRGASGWWSAAYFIPFIGPIALLVVLGLLRGTKQTNAHGKSLI